MPRVPLPTLAGPDLLAVRRPAPDGAADGRADADGAGGPGHADGAAGAADAADDAADAAAAAAAAADDPPRVAAHDGPLRPPLLLQPDHGAECLPILILSSRRIGARRPREAAGWVSSPARPEGAATFSAGPVR